MQLFVHLDPSQDRRDVGAHGAGCACPVFCGFLRNMCIVPRARSWCCTADPRAVLRGTAVVLAIVRMPVLPLALLFAVLCSALACARTACCWGALLRRTAPCCSSPVVEQRAVQYLPGLDTHGFQSKVVAGVLCFSAHGRAVAVAPHLWRTAQCSSSLAVTHSAVL